MMSKEEQKRERFWYWNPPQEGLSIEDCEMIIKESIEEEYQETGHKFAFAIFT